MSQPLTISKLVAMIGDEHIQVQNLAHNLTAGNNGRKLATLTFATSPEHCRQMMRGAAGIKSSVIGLVLWFPSDRLPQVTLAPEHSNETQAPSTMPPVIEALVQSFEAEGMTLTAGEIRRQWRKIEGVRASAAQNDNAYGAPSTADVPSEQP